MSVTKIFKKSFRKSEIFSHVGVIPNNTIVELPLHIAKDCRYGDHVMSGNGHHQISLIGPKLDGIKVQLYVHVNRMYCPYPLRSDIYEGLQLCPPGVTNIEEYQGKFYSDIYTPFNIGKEVIHPRPKDLTWTQIYTNPKYDGFIFHHLGVQYKVKKIKTYDLLAKEDGLYDANEKVFSRTFVNPASIGQIFECRAVFDFETTGKYPKFAIERPRPDKSKPEKFSPVVIEAKDFSFQGTDPLIEYYTSHGINVASCCGGNPGGDVHREGCEKAVAKCYNVMKTRLCAQYWNGFYFNFDPVAHDSTVIAYQREYKSSIGSISLVHSGQAAPYTDKVIEYLELLSSKHAGASVRVIELDGSLSALLTRLGMNVYHQIYCNQNLIVGTPFSATVSIDFIISANVSGHQALGFNVGKDIARAVCSIERGKIVKTKGAVDIDFLVSDEQKHFFVDDDGVLAIVGSAMSYMREGSSYFSVVDKKIVPVVGVDIGIPRHYGKLVKRDALEAESYSHSDIIRANKRVKFKALQDPKYRAERTRVPGLGDWHLFK